MLNIAPRQLLPRPGVVGHTVPQAPTAAVAYWRWGNKIVVHDGLDVMSTGDVPIVHSLDPIAEILGTPLSVF